MSSYLRNVDLIYYGVNSIILYKLRYYSIHSFYFQEATRTLWKIIGEKCLNLQKFIVPKELSYSSTLNTIILNGHALTHLTLKRNVPNNMFLSIVGQNCHNIQELVRAK